MNRLTPLVLAPLLLCAQQAMAAAVPVGRNHAAWAAGSCTTSGAAW